MKGSASIDDLARKAADAVDGQARARSQHAPSLGELQQRAHGRRIRNRVSGGIAVVAVLSVVAGIALPQMSQPLVLFNDPPITQDRHVGPAETEGATVRWWEKNLGAGGLSAGGSFVAANNDAVFAIGGRGFGYVNAVRLDDGSEMWRVQVDPGGGVHLQLATDDLVIANPTYEGLVALAAADGERVWTFKAPDGYGFVSSTVHGDVLIAVAGAPAEQDTRPPVAFALNLATGEQRWATALRNDEEPQCMAPVVVDGHVIVYTTPDGDRQRSGVHALDVATGQQLWTTDVGEPQEAPVCREAKLQVTRGAVHVPLFGSARGGDGTVTLDATNGDKRWVAHDRAVGASEQYLVMRDQQRLYTVNAATGDTMAEGDRLAFARADIDRHIETDGPVVTVDGDRIVFIDPATAKITRLINLAAPANELIVSGETIIVGSQDQGVFVHGASTPRRTAPRSSGESTMGVVGEGSPETPVAPDWHSKSCRVTATQSVRGVTGRFKTAREALASKVDDPRRYKRVHPTVFVLLKEGAEAERVVLRREGASWFVAAHEFCRTP